MYRRDEEDLIGFTRFTRWLSFGWLSPAFVYRSYSIQHGYVQSKHETPSLDFEATKKRRKLWAAEMRAHRQSLGAKLTLGCDFGNYVVLDRSKLFYWTGLVFLVADRGNRSRENASCRLSPHPPFHTRLSMLKKSKATFLIVHECPDVM